jgi:hypothetical protein
VSRARDAASLWWPVAAPPAVWGLQGALVWFFSSLACPQQGAGFLSDAAARTAVAIVTALGLAVVAAGLWVCRSRLHGVAPSPAQAEIVAESHDSVVWAGAFVCAAFAAGLAYGALPALVVGVCQVVR